MNSTVPKSAFQRIQETAGIDKFFFTLLFIGGIFFSGTAVYTILSTVRIVSTTNPLPNIIFLFSVLYVLIEGILAYGFFTASKWLAHILTIHSVIILLTASTILPLMGWADNIIPTLLAGIPIILLAIFVYLKRSLLNQAPVLLVTLIYTALTIISLVLSVIIRM